MQCVCVCCIDLRHSRLYQGPHAYYLCNAMSCIFSWQNFKFYSGSVYGLNFQVEIYSDSSVEIRYGDCSSVPRTKPFVAGMQYDAQGIFLPFYSPCASPSEPGLCPIANAPVPSNIGVRWTPQGQYFVGVGPFTTAESASQYCANTLNGILASVSNPLPFANFYKNFLNKTSMWVGLMRDPAAATSCSAPFYFQNGGVYSSSCNAGGLWCSGQPTANGYLAAFTNNANCLSSDLAPVWCVLCVCVCVYVAVCGHTFAFRTFDIHTCSSGIYSVGTHSHTPLQELD